MSVPIKKATFGNYFTTEVQKNVKAITQAAEGYGFTMKKFNNEKDLNIVLPKDASQTLLEMIENILIQVDDNDLKKQLLQFHEYFVQSIVDTKCQTIFESRDDKTYTLSIVKIQFWKKSTKCLLAYKITNFHYKCAPVILKLANTNEKSKSTTVLVFNSSSYSYTSSQRFVEVDRGVDQEDIRLLLQLSSFGSQDIDSSIQKFICA